MTYMYRNTIDGPLHSLGSRRDAVVIGGGCNDEESLSPGPEGQERRMVLPVLGGVYCLFESVCFCLFVSLSLRVTFPDCGKVV